MLKKCAKIILQVEKGVYVRISVAKKYSELILFQHQANTWPLWGTKLSSILNASKLIVFIQKIFFD
jgi:hypothetical protein